MLTNYIIKKEENLHNFLYISANFEYYKKKISRQDIILDRN